MFSFSNEQTVDLWFLFINKFRCQQATSEKFTKKREKSWFWRWRHKNEGGKGKPKICSKYLMCGFSCWALFSFFCFCSLLFFVVFNFVFYLAVWKCRRFCYVIFLHCLALFCFLFPAFVLLAVSFLFGFSEKWGGKASAIKIKRHFEHFDWLTESLKMSGRCQPNQTSHKKHLCCLSLSDIDETLLSFMTNGSFLLTGNYNTCLINFWIQFFGKNHNKEYIYANKK